MLIKYLPLLIIFLIAILIGLIAIGLGNLFGPKRPSQHKSAPYESGMVPYGPAKRRVSVRYYLIAVLFILFDIEVVFLVPWAVVVRQIGVPGLVLMILFVLVLEVAHLYAWKKGALEWD
ncbi:MAG: NADH-quinone oxidoreductase subunit A [Anaerolineaceae bacterium]|jgi:NADH-quinone oxidoreductase subunit A|nr:NADH-quinone oxidoreductase subunit A [Anaerolineaceae bacterium]